MRSAGQTFDTKLDASTWLSGQVRDVERGIWQPPSEKAATGTLREYAEAWLEARDIRVKTHYQYRMLLDQLILPPLGNVPLDKLSAPTVRNWYGSLPKDKQTWRAHAYSLLRAIYATAVEDEIVPTSPCKIRGAGQSKKQHQTRIATLEELEVIVAEVPSKYRLLILLAAWCGLRFGELTELRRGDVHMGKQVLRVHRAVTRVGSEYHVGPPKTEAGKRDVTIPPHLMPVIQYHLANHVEPAFDALLFPNTTGGHLCTSSLNKVWYPARRLAGREDLHFHDLRHTGATLAAATGATLADLMHRLGHATPNAAMRYQHAAQDRDKAIAEALSEFAVAKVVPLRAVK